MIKNKILLLFLLITIYLIIGRLNIKVNSQFAGGFIGGGNTMNCSSVPAASQEECKVSDGRDNKSGITRSWQCSTYGKDTCITPGAPCSQWQTPKPKRMVTYCCKSDECGVCTKSCEREEEYDFCLSGDYRSETGVSCGERVTTCGCTECIPCKKCEEKQKAALAPVQKSCRCLSFSPVKNAVGKTSFTCTVEAENGGEITNFTVSFKTPSGKIVNLKSSKINPIQCPAGASKNNTCYQVETTAIGATEKGKYEMIIPPQITCQ